MRKVNGEEITIKQLKNSYFGFNEDAKFKDMVKIIKTPKHLFIRDECNRAIIGCPLNLEKDFPLYYVFNEDFTVITVYDFLRNFWMLDEYDIEELTFYFEE